MNARRHRMQPRINVKVQVAVQLREKSRNRSRTILSDNLSPGGAYLVTYVPEAVGTLLDLTFVMPKELADGPSVPCVYTGRVVRVDLVGPTTLTCGMAVQFMYCRNAKQEGLGERDSTRSKSETSGADDPWCG